MSDMITTVIDQMNRRMGDERPAKSIALEIEGEGRILVDEAGARASDDPAACDVRMSVKTFEGLVAGKVNPMTAVMTRKIKVSGDMTAAMGLSKLL